MQEVVSGTAVRIMTGAPIPPGADAVVKVEDCQVDGEDAWIHTEVEVGNYVRPAGEDVREGCLVLRRGAKVRPQEVGMLAALGRSEILATRRPRVAILATGDELVGIDEPLTPGKIRDMNSYSNAAQVAELGGEPILLGIARDRVDDLTAKIQRGLEQRVDLFLSSGGVSVGEYDLVKDVLTTQGQMDFWRVRMKPGKPLAFGHINGVPALGLPGNPVSAMVAFEMFVRPALLTMLGKTEWRRPSVRATLMNPIGEKDDRRHFVRVRLAWENDEYHAYLTGEQGSGILSSMLEANALAVIPEDWDRAELGDRVQAVMLEGEE
jgi:molybdopterin molybdotransferase